MKTPKGVRLLCDIMDYYDITQGELAMLLEVTHPTITFWVNPNYRITPNAENRMKIFQLAMQAGLIKPKKFGITHMKQYFQ